MLLTLTGVRPTASQDPARSNSSDRAAHRGFSFSAGTCELGPQFCTISVPRDWTQADFELVRGSLDEIAATELGRRIIDRALANGFRTVRRYERAARLDPERGYLVEP